MIWAFLFNGLHVDFVALLYCQIFNLHDGRHLKTLKDLHQRPITWYVASAPISIPPDCLCSVFCTILLLASSLQQQKMAQVRACATHCNATMQSRCASIQYNNTTEKLHRATLPVWFSIWTVEFTELLLAIEGCCMECDSKSCYCVCLPSVILASVNFLLSKSLKGVRIENIKTICL